MKAFIVDVTNVHDQATKNEIYEYARENNSYFGQHTFMRVFQYEEDDFSFDDEDNATDLIPLTRAWVQARNTENLPVFLHVWW